MDLEPLLLSCIQFAFVVSFHIIFPAFTIGLAAWLATIEGMRLATRKDGVELAELVGADGRHHHAMRPVIVRTPVEVLEVQGKPAIALSADLQNPEAGLNHLGPDAVTAYGGNLVRTHLILLISAVCWKLPTLDERFHQFLVERSGNTYGIRSHRVHPGFRSHRQQRQSRRTAAHGASRPLPRVPAKFP